jgi:hypothetical protein
MRSPKPVFATAKFLADAKDRVNSFARDCVPGPSDDGDVGKPETFADRLRILSRLAGSDSKLAAMCGLGRATLSTAIREDGGRIMTARLLREHINVDLNWLICGDGDPGDLRFPTSTAESIAERVKPPRRPKHSGRHKARTSSPKSDG